MLSSVAAAETVPEITSQLQKLCSISAEVLDLLDQYFCLEHKLKNMAVPILPSWTFHSEALKTRLKKLDALIEKYEDAIDSRNDTDSITEARLTDEKLLRSSTLLTTALHSEMATVQDDLKAMQERVDSSHAVDAAVLEQPRGPRQGGNRTRAWGEGVTDRLPQRRQADDARGRRWRGVATNRESETQTRLT